MTSILLIDDDMNLLRGLRRGLRDQPYQLFIANSAEMAMSMFRSYGFDLVVVDQQMSGRNGTEFVSWVAEHFPDTIRIMLTGHADVEVMMKAINAGRVFRFLTKPCRDLELAMAIRDGLDSRQVQSHTTP